MRCPLAPWLPLVAWPPLAAWVAAALSTFLASSLAAEPLSDALSRVYEDSPRLQAGREGLRAVDEGVARARAGGRPFLSGTSTVGVGTDWSHAQPAQSQSLRLTQSLYNGGQTSAEIARAEDEVQAERARLAQLESDVLLEAIAAYVGVAREGSILELARGNEERLRLQLDATRDRERFGDATRTDIAQSQTRFARATADRIAAQGSLSTAEAEYRRVTGQEPGGLKLPDPPEAVAASAAEAQGQAERSFRALAAGHDVAAAREEVAVAVAAMRPKLSLGAEIGIAGSADWQADQRSGASVGATLTVPLYQGGGEQARVRQSKNLLLQRRWARDGARRDAEAEIAAAWQAQATTEAAIKALESQVDAAGFALDGVRQEALVGARLVLDILDAEQELFAAEVALVRARGDRVLAGYRLQAAVGRLSARDLALPVAFDDPDAHLDATSGRWFGLGEPAPDD